MKAIEKYIPYLLLILLVFSLIPIIYVGRYNHAMGDDYYYGAATHRVFVETGNIAAVLMEAAKGVAEQYYAWQGTYSAMFLMYLAPNIWGERAYALVTPTLVFLLTFGIFYLCRAVICGCLKGGTSLYLSTSCVLSFLSIQTLPSQGEALFWYNGSMYYTGFFSLTLIFFGVVLRYLLTRRKRYIWVMVMLALFLGGGNYVSLLPVLIILFLAAPVFMIHDSKKGMGKSRGIVLAALFLLLFIGLCVSAAAPGNSIRQADIWKIPAWKAILKSLIQGIRYLAAWLSGWWVAGALLLLPFFLSSYQKLTFRFPCPLLVTGLVYGIFCSMSCPLFYTMNSTGPARAVSIVYYGFILSTFFCYYYILGYLHRLLAERNISFRRLVPTSLFPAASIVLTVFLCLSGHAGNLTVVKSTALLISGEARAYDEEYQARLEILNDPEITDVVLSSFIHQPDMLYNGDLGANPADDLNQKVAYYFNKSSVIVVSQ